MNNTSDKLIILTHLLENHGVPKKGTAMAKRFCQEVGIEIVQILRIRKGVSILVNEQQGTDALNVWKEKEARRVASEPQVRPDESVLGRLEARMLEHERLLNTLVEAQNLAADRLTTLLKELCGDPAADCAKHGPAS